MVLWYFQDCLFVIIYTSFLYFMGLLYVDMLCVGLYSYVCYRYLLYVYMICAVYNGIYGQLIMCT